MATGGDDASCSSESLICPLCLDVFEDATLLSCGHTFCRKCLKRYDASHLDRDHMECPLCSCATKLQENRVEGLPANATVNGLVYDYHSNTGGLYTSLELKAIKCTMCAKEREAVSFCKECNAYMCKHCLSGHQEMSLLFADHHVLSMSEVCREKFNIPQYQDKCSIHKQGIRDLICEECRVYVCFKCVIIAHRDHKIRNHRDFERELQVKVESLIKRCKFTKTELEKNIQNTEARRQEVHEAVQELEIGVRDAYEKKARQLKENERLLLEELQSLKKGFDDDLVVLKLKDRERIKRIVDSVSLVANDRLGCLEVDSLAAHCMLCDELDQTLKEVKDDTSAGVISKTARKKLFNPADGSLLHLGEIRSPVIRIRTEVDLIGEMKGMAALSEDKVIICYDSAPGFYRCGWMQVDTTGNTSQHFEQDEDCYDIAYQRNTGNTVIVGDSSEILQIYSHSGSYMHTQDIPKTCGSFHCISTNHNDEIIMSDWEDCVMIYDSSLSAEQCRITTGIQACQALETRSGAIIVSTAYVRDICKVRSYDRNGRKAGYTLTGDPGRWLYAAADSQDRVYVASVNQTGAVITQYKMVGLQFKKVCQFEELKLTLNDGWCYLVSLSCDMLALSSSKKVYFIEVNYPSCS